MRSLGSFRNFSMVLLRYVMLLSFCCSPWAVAQRQGPPQPGGPTSEDLAEKDTATIHGKVVDRFTGEPIPKAVVFLGATPPASFQHPVVPRAGMPPDSLTTTDAQGAFTLRKVVPGDQGITAVFADGFLNRDSRRVRVAAGETVEGLIFRMARSASISGQVFDEKGAPLEGAQITVVLSEYNAGTLRYVRESSVRTDEDGHYSLKSLIRPGRKVWLMATWQPLDKRAIAADAPVDIKLRRRAFSRAFYPGTADIESASALGLKGSEDRGGIDFHLQREPALCISGKVSGPDGYARLAIYIESANPAFGSGGFEFPHRTLLEGARDYRICGLPAGAYKLEAVDLENLQEPAIYGVARVDLRDRDSDSVDIVLGGPSKIPVAVEWADEAPTEEASGQIRVSLFAREKGRLPGVYVSVNLANIGLKSVGNASDAVSLSGFEGEYGLVIRLPGLEATRLPTGLGSAPEQAKENAGIYVKDVRYGEDSVYGRPLRISPNASGNTILIRLAHDAATVRVKVGQNGGEAADNAFVYLLPETAKNEADLAFLRLTGQTDQMGQFTWSRSVPPGTYRAVATRRKIEDTAEDIDYLWKLRTQGKKVQVSPRGQMDITIQLVEEP